VHEANANASSLHHQRVTVRGHFHAGFEDTFLWNDEASYRRRAADMRIFIAHALPGQADVEAACSDRTVEVSGEFVQERLMGVNVVIPDAIVESR
jgi:hypothetical protein